VALDAAQAEGGDLRGCQSAALVVVGAEPAAPGRGRRIDVRVDDHPEPLVELRRLVALAAPYAELDRAIELVGALDLDGVDAARTWVADWGGDRDRVGLLWRHLIASGMVPDDPGVVGQVLA
jgi:uncharacterized Ntn-hydrolase superfamily protein